MAADGSGGVANDDEHRRVVIQELVAASTFPFPSPSPSLTQANGSWSVANEDVRRRMVMQLSLIHI